jgi:ABC-2 type transport system permease protein
MNAALFRKELKHHRTQLIIWAASIAGLSLITMAAMPTMLANASAIGGFITAFPQGMLKAFSFDASSFTDPLGFYVVYSTLYVALIGSAFSMSVSVGIIAREEGQGSADFLLAKPVTRRDVAITKIAAWLLLVIALNVVTFFAGWASLAAFSPLPWRFAAYVTLSVYSVLLSVSLGAVGLLFSLVVKRARSLTGPGIGIVLGFYLWDAVAKMNESYDAWGWISPFKWMDLKVTAPGYALAGWRVALFAVLAVGSAAAAVLVYRRKDILS